MVVVLADKVHIRYMIIFFLQWYGYPGTEMQVRVLCFYESVGVTCDNYLVEKWIGVEIPVLLCVLHQSSRYFAFGLVSILDKKMLFYLLVDFESH